MFKRLLIHFIVSLIADHARRGRQLLKIEGARHYVQAVSHLRSFFNFVFICLGCIIFAQVGLALLVYGGISYFTTELLERSIAFLVTGSLLFFIPLGVFLFLNSESRWSRRTGVPELINSVLPETHRKIRKLERKEKYGVQ